MKQLEESFIVKCPYRGCFVDLAKLEDHQLKSDEYRCPNCDEWVWTDLTWQEPFRQQPFPKNSARLRHPENYKCLVDPKKWYDKDLNLVDIE